jgi:hypothetical protein
LKVDNFNSVEQQHAWMKSAEFARNPAGTPIDPDDFVARFRAGASAEELTGFH